MTPLRTEDRPGIDYQRFLEAADEGYWAYEPGTGRAFLSSRCWTLLGDTASEVPPAVDAETFAAFVDRFLDDGFARALTDLEAPERSDERFGVPVRARHRDGGIRHLVVRGRVAGDDGTDRPRTLLGTLSDATEREQARSALDQALRFQELVFSAQQDLMFVKDDQFRIVQANDAFLAVYPEEIRDKVIGTTTFEAYDEAQRREFVAEDQRALDTGYSETEETIDFPSGGRRTLWTKKSRFEDADGNAFVLAVARDVTDQKETERALRRANEELEEFAYRVSHDLRSPLVSALRLVEHGHEAVERGDDALARRTLPVAIDALQRLQGLADDLLDLTRLRFTDREATVIDLPALVAQTWERQCEEQQAPPIRFDTDYALDAPVVSDLRAVTAILYNLLSNAIKYRDRERDDNRVSVHAHSDRFKLSLQIADNGLGVPPDLQDRLFRMFERMHPSLAGGSGLGLYMVRSWCERLGGSVLAEHPDRGIRFLIELPHLRASDAAETTNQATQEHPGT